MTWTFAEATAATVGAFDAALEAIARHRRRLSVRQREALYQDLASALETGLPLVDTLEQMRATIVRDPLDPPDHERRRTPVSEALGDFARSERSGEGFAAALPRWVPREEATLIAAGAEASQLPKTLRESVRIIEARRLSRETIKKAITYPSLLVLALFVLLAGIAFFLVPQFAEILPVERWTGFAALLATTADIVTSSAIPFLVLVATAVLFYGAALERWHGSGILGRLRVRVDRHPPFAYYRLLIGAQVMIAFAALKTARMSDRESIAMIRDGASPWLAERLDAIAHYVREGNKIGDAMVLSGHEFPDRDLIWRIRVHSDRGSLEESLPLIAHTWLDDSNGRIRRQASWLNIALTLFVALTLAFIFLGYFDLVSQVGSELDRY